MFMAAKRFEVCPSHNDVFNLCGASERPVTYTTQVQALPIMEQHTQASEEEVALQ